MAREIVSPKAQQSLVNYLLCDILFADDSMILGSAVAEVQELAAAIEKIRAELGMSFHWGKTQLLRINATEGVPSPNGQAIQKQRDTWQTMANLILNFPLARAAFRKVSKVGATVVSRANDTCNY